ncbi:MAG: 8-amino-7-oxononanoate synthase [Gammaproteobacteria bacterium]
MIAEKFEKSLQALKDRDLYRYRRINQGPQGPDVEIDGQRLLNFCSNDYLGLANHPALIAAFKRGAERYGVGAGSAHLISGHTSAHHSLEEELAEFTGFPRTLLFSTGYMANLGAISGLTEKGDRVFEDRLNHASLLDGGLLSGARFQRYPHADLKVLGEYLAQGHGAWQLVVTDGVFSMDGDLADLRGLCALCQSTGAGLLVDDAHGLGVLGQTGRGLLEYSGVDPHNVTLLVGTLGKAFGTFGAFVAGSDSLIETLIQRARTYIYTTAIPPAVAEATRVSLKLVRGESWRREKLASLVQRFRKGAQERQLPLLDSITPIQPVVFGDSRRTLEISARLKQRGIFVMPIRPPSVPNGSARLRIALSALHEEAHVDRLLQELQEAIPHD